MSVNGGRVSSHVSRKTKESFACSFTPADMSRHRVDVKFNGEKVQGSPWFLEVSHWQSITKSSLFLRMPWV